MKSYVSLINWFIRSMAIIVAMLFLSQFKAFPASAISVEHWRVENTSSATAFDTPDMTLVDPLPGGCPGNLPGDAPAVCCISGFVYLDGQPIAGAEVEIVNETGGIAQLQTDTHPGHEKRPYYRMASLGAPPLHVAPGDLITITARYAGQEYQIRSYEVQPGGQQVDLVLARRQPADTQFVPWLGGQSDKEQLNWPLGLAVDSVGNIYVADSSNARIQVFTPTGQFLRQWGSTGHLRGQFRNPTGIVVDSNDHVYVTDMGNHRVQKFTTDGSWLMMWGNWGSKAGNFDEPYDVAVDKQNNVYITDSRNHRIQKFDLNGKFLSTWGKLGANLGEFKFPHGIAIDQNNMVYIADTDHSRIQIFNENGQLLKVIGAEGSAPGQFNCPFDIAVDNDGNLYVADRLNSRIQKISPNGDPLHIWGTRGNLDGQFNNPRGIVVDSQDSVYVADTFNDRIQRFNANGVFNNTWGSRGLNNGVFNTPQVVAVDSASNLYVADTFNDRVQKFDSTGKFLTTWGGFGRTDGKFYEPHGIAVHPNGNVYVVDRINHRVQIFDGNGNFIDKWGTFGSLPRQFKYPWGILITNNGEIYVTDSENYRVQKFDSSGNFAHEWGSQGNGENQFDLPRGIAIDSQNNIYIADRQNHRVQKFTSAGVFIRSFGVLGSDDGKFKYPDSVFLDGNDNIYVVDRENHRIQKLAPNGNHLMNWGKRGTLQGGFLYPSDFVISGNGQMIVADSASSRIFRSLPITFTSPIATINHLSANATSLPTNGVLTVRGRGQDSDETDIITDYRWTLDKDSILGASKTLEITASQLAQGTHRITLEVQDNEGDWSEPVSTNIYVAEPPKATWTMLLYLVGDYADGGQLMRHYNNVLQTLRTSLNNPHVRIAIQIDGPASIGTASKDTRRLLISPGSPPQVVEESFGEQAMDNPQTLAAFVHWGQEQFPAEHYYLAIADHGQAIQGIGWDASSPGSENYLTVTEIVQALNEPGIAPIDLLHLDGCSMNLIDVAYELRNSTDYLIASQYLAWSYFAYDQYQLGVQPTTKSAQFAQSIVDKYAQLAHHDNVPFTLTALNLARAEPIMNGVNNLSVLLKAWVEIDPNDAARRKALLGNIRSHSQKFNSNQDFLNNDLDAYVDLLNWVTNLSNEPNEPFTDAIRQSAASLLSELNGPAGVDPFILRNQAESDLLPADKLPIAVRPHYPNGAPIDLNRASGISLYYPVFALVSAASASAPAFDVVYNNYVNERIYEFTSVSHWNEFLKSVVGIPTEGQPLDPPPGPLPALAQPARQLFLPLVSRN